MDHGSQRELTLWRGTLSYGGMDHDMLLLLHLLLLLMLFDVFACEALPLAVRVSVVSAILHGEKAEFAYI